MKSIKHIFFVLALFSIQLNAYSQLFDDFSDGDFTNNPTWTGTESLFLVENEVLRSNSPGESEYFLSTPNTLIDDVQWDFYVKFGFATSGSNYGDIYLVSDNSDLSAVQNGYFLRIGGTPDEISLFKKINGDNFIIIDGDDGLVNSSSNNIFDLRITRSSAGEWSIFYDKNQTGTFTAGGNVVDNEITSTSHFGVFIKQSTASTPINKHFFDNFSIAPIPVDETPPTLVSGIAISDTEIELTFNEALDETSAENIANYSVSGIFSSVIEAELSNSNPLLVTLTLDIAIPNGETAIITVTNVEDLEGNAMSAESIEVLYFVSDIAGFKDVVINEIFADPTPVIGMPEAEYLEIFNAGDGIFDLENWTLVNTTTAKVLTSAVLLPGDFLILCDAENAELFSPFGSVLGIPSFSALSNAADSLTLLNPDGDIIDIVVYSDSWYDDSEKAQGGYSLELINPFTVCSGSNNWSATNSAEGGTPGIQNSIFDITPDTAPPLIDSYQLLSDQTLQINFNEPMDESSLENGSFIWNEGITNSAILVGPNLQSIQLQLSSPLEVGIEYVLNISEITDCAGNEINTNTEIDIFLGEEPQLYELLISEIMADPSPSNGLPEGEYFELYNASDKTIDVVGISLNDKVFTQSRILFPGDYLLCIDEDLTLDFLLYPNAYILEELGTTYFTNGGREVILYNANGDEIDRANYNLTWYHDASKEDGGYSLERINLEEPCRAGDNWTAASHESGGTPGEVNSVNNTDPDITAPTVTTVFVMDSTHLEVHFSETIDELSILSATVTVSPDIAILELSPIYPDLNAVRIELADPLVENIIYSLSVMGFADCVGNENAEKQMFNFGLPRDAEVGDILINEVLFNPQTGGSDFVEVVNVSDKIISLQDWALQNEDLTTRIITINPVLMFPGDYIVFTASPQNIIQEYPFGQPENYLGMESLPSYSSTSGSVILIDQDEEVMDKFDYSESYHFSLLNTFKGVSLERTSFTRPTNDGGNWTSAAETVGFATPGYLNSQYNPEGSARTSFEFENEVFSPDNDGFEDILNLNYSLESPGYVATIEIYDRSGRLLKTLENNLLLATSGTISWDGVTDEGIKARIGPHIYVVSLYNLNGNTEIIKIPCIVAGRLSN